MMQLTYIKNWLLVSIFMLTGYFTLAQVGENDGVDRRFRVYTYKGETFMIGEIEGIDITAKMPSKQQIRRGKKRLAKFTRLRWNVHKVYPYAVKVSDILNEVEKEMALLPDSITRRDYIKSKEKSLFGSYENDLRQMTRSQGRVLVKLVHRQTGQSTFELIKDTKSGASAVFWQSIGLLFGINLKTEFDFDADEDAMIEAVVNELERGGYNIAYRSYNYRLN
ncbi:MAG: DUF4294 domain-containing protein [Bacteroidetes bacterium]|nr:DUF4294 domain-containing protein [Bacteroidota bacterium]